MGKKPFLLGGKKRGDSFIKRQRIKVELWHEKKVFD